MLEGEQSTHKKCLGARHSPGGHQGSPAMHCQRDPLRVMSDCAQIASLCWLADLFPPYCCMHCPLRHLGRRSTTKAGRTWAELFHCSLVLPNHTFALVLVSGKVTEKVRQGQEVSTELRSSRAVISVTHLFRRKGLATCQGTGKTHPTSPPNFLGSLDHLNKSSKP